MTDITTAVAASAVTGAASAISIGRPPQEVIIWSALGAIVAVWLESQDREGVSANWFLRTIGLVFVSVFSGIIGSALIQSIPDIPILGHAAQAERWITAGIIAAMIHKVGPLVYRIFKWKLGKQERVGDVDRN